MAGEIRCNFRLGRDYDRIMPLETDVKSAPTPEQFAAREGPFLETNFLR
jgi:hypothetical protein